MADILRVTTPLVNKYQAVDPKRGVEIPQFNLQDLSRVAKPLADNELLQQHNGLTQERETSALLLDMLKDPSITVGFLKNISLLQEVIRLMPLGSRTLTGEIQQLFDQLLLLPDDLFTEMLFQEEASTWFRGEVFDLLRAALEESPGDVPLRQAAVDFLKSLNSCWTQQDSLDSVANNLQYLSDALSASRGLSQRLLDLSRQLRRPGAGERFDELKHGVMEVLREVEDSILFSPKMEKVVSIAVYNLSRFGGGTQRLQQSLEGLLDRLPPRVRDQFLAAAARFLEQPPRAPEARSRVMDALAKILVKQTESEELMGQNSEKVDKILHSLLSSPSNFTPLLHFVLPLQYQNVQSFMEFWVNPNGEEDQYWAAEEGKKKIHMLMVFDIGSLGRFEMELFVRDDIIDFALLCPPSCARVFAGAREDIRKSIGGLGYRFGEMRIDALERPRSLIEVFHSLPFKRAGVDVKI